MKIKDKLEELKTAAHAAESVYEIAYDDAAKAWEAYEDYLVSVREASDK